MKLIGSILLSLLTGVFFIGFKEFSNSVGSEKFSNEILFTQMLPKAIGAGAGFLWFTLLISTIIILIIILIRFIKKKTGNRDLEEFKWAELLFKINLYLSLIVCIINFLLMLEPRYY